jgi:bacterioferritin
MPDIYADVKLIDVLNDLRARELAVIMQYMRQYYTVTGPTGMLHANTFKGISVAEMKHAESLAVRIEFLGGAATTKPEAFVTEFADFKEMAKSDFSAESDAVMRYRAAIKFAQTHGDPTTRRLLESILADEEDHLKTFSDMLGGDVIAGELLDPALAL